MCLSNYPAISPLTHPPSHPPTHLPSHPSMFPPTHPPSTHPSSVQFLIQAKLYRTSHLVLTRSHSQTIKPRMTHTGQPVGSSLLNVLSGRSGLSTYCVPRAFRSFRCSREPRCEYSGVGECGVFQELPGVTWGRDGLEHVDKTQLRSTLRVKIRGSGVFHSQAKL